MPLLTAEGHWHLQVLLPRHRPWDGRRWTCKGESKTRGPTCSSSEVYDFLDVTGITTDGVKTDVCLSTSFMQL